MFKTVSVCGAFACLLLSGFAFAQESGEPEPQMNAVEMAIRAARGGQAKIDLPGKVFLRNKYSFKKGRKSEGASSSLVVKDGKVYVLTAKHLLGEAMAISPEVSPTAFAEHFKKWKVYHNDTGKTAAKVTGIYKPNDDMGEDIIMLETDAAPEDVADFTLNIASSKPKTGDKLYVIGCPYSARNCSQRAYAGEVAAITNFEDDPTKPQNLVLLDMTHAPDRLAGFSGAAMINEDMEIVAVVYGGRRILMAATLLPEWVAQ